jgi:hypothetical protein
LALKQFYIKNVGPAKIQRVQQNIQKVCYILDKESKRKKLKTPVKETSKNLPDLKHNFFKFY